MQLHITSHKIKFMHGGLITIIKFIKQGVNMKNLSTMLFAGICVLACAASLQAQNTSYQVGFVKSKHIRLYRIPAVIMQVAINLE